MQNNMLMPDTPEQKNSLKHLGLKQDMFKIIGLRILTAYNQTTSNDAAMAPGMYAYLAAVRSSRDVLRNLGWVSKKQSNIELATNKQKGINILVSSGNAYIGRKDGDPGNKNPKGTQTQKIIFKNSRQLSLLPELNADTRVEDESSTWFLFYRLDVKNQEMRMELSLPTKFDFKELKVTGWVQRIFLKPIEFDGGPVDIEPDFAPEIEFDIRRKANE